MMLPVSLLILPCVALALDTNNLLPPFMDPYEAVVGPDKPAPFRKTIDFKNNEPGQGTVMNQGGLSTLDMARSRAMGAAYAPDNGNVAQALSRSEDGKPPTRATGMRYGDSAMAAGAEDEKALNRLRKAPNANGGEDDHAYLTANDVSLNTAVKYERDGSHDAHEAIGEKAGFINDVKSFRENRGGSGALQQTKNGEAHDWTISQSGQDTEATLKEQNAGRFGFDHRCKAEKVGESTCVNQNGQTVGKVVTDSNLNAKVLVADPITKRGAVPVAMGKCEERNNKEYDCRVGQGVLTATVEDYREYNCLDDYGMGANGRMEINFNDETFNYNHEVSSGGKKTFQFPDCFDASTEVSLENFSAEQRKDFGKRLAMEWDVNVLPIGKLSCQDPSVCATRKDDCYYCNGCDQQQQNRVSNVFGNMDASSLCDAGDRTSFRTKTTVCPPPKAFDWAHCYSFGYQTLPSASDMAADEGDLVVTQIFYLLPDNIADIKADCEKKVKGFFSKVKLQTELISSDYKEILEKQLKRGGKGGGLESINSDRNLQRFCEYKAIRELMGSKVSGTPKYDLYKGEMVGCKRAEIKYSIGGSQRGANNFLLKSAGTANTWANIFNKKNCPNL